MAAKTVRVTAALTGSIRRTRFLVRSLRMTKPTARRGARSALPLLIVSLSILAACNVRGSAINGSADALRIVVLEGLPLHEVASGFHPQNRQHLEAFTASVPEPLPEMAYVSSVILDPFSPPPPADSSIVLGLDDGYIKTHLALANPGTNTNQPTLVCLRNGTQVACTPKVDLWKATLPPESIALVPIRIAATPGDHLVFLIMAHDEPLRYKPSSQMLWAYVENEEGKPTRWVDAPEIAPPLAGCGFAALIKDPADTSPANFNLHDGVRRGTPLYVLIKLCEPTGSEYVQLITLIDRSLVANMDGSLLGTPIRLTGVASLIPLPTSGLEGSEIQVAVVPLSPEAALEIRRHSFTQAFSLKP